MNNFISEKVSGILTDDNSHYYSLRQISFSVLWFACEGDTAF